MSDIIAEISSPVIDVQVGNGIHGTDVIDSLTSTSAEAALSAKQGSVLKGLVDTNAADIATNTAGIAALQPVDSLTSTSTTAPLSANQGKVLKGYVDARVPLDNKVSNTKIDFDSSDYWATGVHYPVASTSGMPSSSYGVLEVFKARYYVVQRFTVSSSGTATTERVWMRNGYISSGVITWHEWRCAYFPSFIVDNTDPETPVNVYPTALPVYTYTTTHNEDFLKYTEPGIYCRVYDSTHSCTSDGSRYGVLEVMASGSSYRIQRYTAGTIATCPVYVRRLASSSDTWTAGSWYKLTAEAVE